jgi:transcriptional regulator with XRE-family HTH domain
VENLSHIKRFGDYIRELRIEKEITLKQMSECLGISLGLLSDIENHRRSPFDKERLEIFADKVGLGEEGKNCLYDLAGRDSRRIPYDIEEVIMYTPEGDLARLALRKTKSGELTIEDWKRLIQKKENEKE